MQGLLKQSWRVEATTHLASERCQKRLASIERGMRNRGLESARQQEGRFRRATTDMRSDEQQLNFTDL
eukprot:3412095-Pyramimonas_sp.AAC.1